MRNNSIYLGSVSLNSIVLGSSHCDLILLVRVVLLCADGGLVLPSGAVSGSNLVVVEGGPKGIRKMVHLMLNRYLFRPPLLSVWLIIWCCNRIAWDVMVEASTEARRVVEEEQEEGAMEEEEGRVVEGEADGGGQIDPDVAQCLSKDNRCDLLWRGVLPKRSFQGFKFQECKTASAARKFLEAKGVAHYWDMAYRADEMLEVTNV